jgi:hypothetical protein
VKKQLLVAVVVVLALAGAMPAYAQGNVSKVNVPFPFIVGDTVLPAGSYTVTTPSDGVLAIQSATSQAVATALVQPTGGELSKNTNALFSFAKMGGQYFLAQVSLPGAEARTLPLPKGHVSAMLAKLNGSKVHTGPAL